MEVDIYEKIFYAHFVMVSVSLSFALDLVGGISYNTYNFDFFSNDELISLFFRRNK